ncbi:GH39 family glycosyl hydrolase [Paenibacillus sp. DMB20]|uniref:GH39 family glycosyl hydrolase n=1 Tax=Paenibacillus sp. DMB20 TaxID=1642570 RepID=UPI0006276A85|nr:helix-turn-helix domain-containing protein [Paenibacillus sp. DMB20]KKO53099.1 AraC family transcriptional regulator [Paenibacillus sp. DMB20]
MKSSIFELVETGDHLPFDVSLHRVNYVPSHWHNSVEIIFVLRGTLEATVGNERHTLTEGDVFLINSSHVHEVIGLDMNIIATFLIPMSYLKENIKGIEDINFICESHTAEPGQKGALDQIRQLLAEMVHLKHKMGEAYELDMGIRMLAVFSILMKRFKTSDSGGAINEKYMERMLRIINYIDEHYKEPLSLQTIAEREFLSMPYLSKFFSENIGLNFQSYLTSIRLKNAVEDLLHYEDLPITDLALSHGFPNAKSFYAAFKNRYHMTPHEYRKQYRPDKGMERRQKDISSNYLHFNQSSALGIIRQYLQRSQSAQDVPIQAIETRVYEIDAAAAGKALKHTWRNLITIGKAKEGLHADVQQQLKYVQQNCSFRYLRFHGIFDDGMMVYDEDETGEPRHNFRLVDQLFDFLLSIRLKPFVELGFMPSALAADPDKRVFYRASYTSPPKSLDKWCALVGEFVRHCMNRYGAAEVAGWKFEFWNEPEFKVFWPAAEEEYHELYLRTYRTVKGISEALQIGAPGRIITANSRSVTLRFFDFCRENHCLPDFIPLHFYPHDEIGNVVNTEHMDLTLDPGVYRKLQEEFGGISSNPDFLKDKLGEELEMLAEQGLSGREIYLTEWNSTAYHRELTNDTLYKAAYIAKNILDNLDAIHGFGYWVLSDNIEETFPSPQLFHGGLGLIAQYGIPKAAMNAYRLLSKLGDRLIAKGDGYVVTANNSGYQILTYNYCHYDDLYAQGDISFIDETHRYNGFKNEKTLKMDIILAGLPKGSYKMVTRTISRKHGSSYDAWVEMGAPASLTGEDIAYLKGSSEPRRHVQVLDIENGTSIGSQLGPHEVQLIELSPVH